VVICDPRGYWETLLERWRGRLPLPDARVAEERAERAERLARALLADGDEDAALEQAVAMLTQRARARLLRRGVYPASRPELPAQLREIGAGALADTLERALGRHPSAAAALAAVTTSATHAG